MLPPQPADQLHTHVWCRAIRPWQSIAPIRVVTVVDLSSNGWERIACVYILRSQRQHHTRLRWPHSIRKTVNRSIRPELAKVSRLHDDRRLNVPRLYGDRWLNVSRLLNDRWYTTTPVATSGNPDAREPDKSHSWAFILSDCLLKSDLHRQGVSSYQDELWHADTLVMDWHVQLQHQWSQPPYNTCSLLLQGHGLDQGIPAWHAIARSL